ncbi:MAG: radical SAM family heme chaperone HemW [Chloroflexota bacterium]
MKPNHNQSLSIYLHIPFCTTKCTYCAFNTYTHLEHLIDAFVTAICTELMIASQDNPYDKTETIFFGGGTPSLLSPVQFTRILEALFQYYHIASDAEISIEANPNDLQESYLKDLRRLGINRLSIGMQSANTRELQLFQRRHDNRQVIQAVTAARAAGFDNINLDLIYGVPDQTLDDWRQSLSALIALEPEHVSLYALGVEDGTPMKHWIEKGTLPQPDDDLTADMYEIVTDVLDEAGFRQYEISNWAKPGKACRHNLQYWHNKPYLGFGPGAHGFANNIRYETVLSPQRYIRCLQDVSTVKMPFPMTPAVAASKFIDGDEAVFETVLTNLRLVEEGINRATFAEQFGFDLVAAYQGKLDQFVAYGLIEIEPDRIRLTRSGRFVSNAIIRDLL